MKSNKQRRAEIMARRALRKRMAAIKKDVVPWPPGNVLVDLPRLAPNNSYGYACHDFVARGYYLPIAFTCRDCGVPEVWSAESQKWWYEEMKGDIFTTAIRCRPCRARERERKQLAKQKTAAGYAKKLEALAIK
jgi:predicted nucleic-acid-binding Zn-ribbon protein